MSSWHKSGRAPLVSLALPVGIGSRPSVLDVPIANTSGANLYL